MELEEHKELAHQAAERWTARLAEGRIISAGNLHTAADLADFAFLCKSIALDHIHVGAWAGPFHKLETGEPFTGCRPWDILLNHACKLAGAPHV